MNQIKNKLLVMSGKGGVGKTTVAINLAHILADLGFKVGLLDADIHGPNVAKMLKIEDEKLKTNGENILPIILENNLKVMSVAFIVEKEKSVIWRGPMKHKLITQFVNDVLWGDLDYLIIDFPPGTGDEQISVSQLIQNITGSIIVSTPQKVSILDSVRSVDFSRTLKIPIIGLIENMSNSVFGKDTIKEVAKEKNVDFLGKISMNESIVTSSDEGTPFVKKDNTPKSELKLILDKIIRFCEK